MSAKSQTLAKSLHTVSVLVNVARLRMQLAPTMTAAYAVESALCDLGYHGAADPYGLAAKAVAVLSAERAS